jgi:hypothetical protein
LNLAHGLADVVREVAIELGEHFNVVGGVLGFVAEALFIFHAKSVPLMSCTLPTRVVRCLKGVSFAAGCLVGTPFVNRIAAQAESNRVFELFIYHARPGKGPALESLFRDASKVISNHGMQVVGYWVLQGDPTLADTFVYLVAHPSSEDAKTRWDAIHTDPKMRLYNKEAADHIIDRADNKYRVDEVYMRAADFFAMK